MRSACGAVRAAVGIALVGLSGAWDAAVAGPRVGMITIEGKPADRPGPFDWLASSEKNSTLASLVKALDRAGAIDDMPGVLIKLRDAELGRAQVEELGAAMDRLKGKGKGVFVFSDQYGPSELLLASHASRVYAQQGAPVMLSGLHMEEMFLADTLQWAGVKANMVQIGDYKGASEQIARSSPSEKWSQNIDGLLDSIYANMRAELKAGRGLSDEQLDAAMRDLWLADSDAAKRHRLVDDVIDFPAIREQLKDAVRSGDAVDLDAEALAPKKKSSLDMGNPFAMFSLFSKKPDHKPKGPTIAVLHIDGAIVDGDSKDGGLFGGGGSVGSRTIRNAIEEILDEEKIEGVIVRIDSPGGSATASEIIWQGLRRLASKKKVWASVGGMAASGGYYCAVGADKIYVNPSSIVGSIGVVGGRLGMDGLYKNLKVGVRTRSRGPMADMFRSTTEWSPEELATVKRKMTETYDQFTSRVKAGRPGIDLATTAEGRLFTGDKAVPLHMADKVGGLEIALADLAKELELSKYDVLDYPGPKSLEEVFEDMFGGIGVRSPVGGASLPGSMLMPRGEMGLDAVGKAVFGTRAWREVSRAMQGTLLLRDHPVILMTPSVFVFE